MIVALQISHHSPTLKTGSKQRYDQAFDYLEVELTNGCRGIFLRERRVAVVFILIVLNAKEKKISAKPCLEVSLYEREA